MMMISKRRMGGNTNNNNNNNNNTCSDGGITPPTSSAHPNGNRNSRNAGGASVFSVAPSSDAAAASHFAVGAAAVAVVDGDHCGGDDDNDIGNARSRNYVHHAIHVIDDMDGSDVMDDDDNNNNSKDHPRRLLRRRRWGRFKTAALFGGNSSRFRSRLGAVAVLTLMLLCASLGYGTYYRWRTMTTTTIPMSTIPMSTIPMSTTAAIRPNSGKRTTTTAVAGPSSDEKTHAQKPKTAAFDSTTRLSQSQRQRQPQPQQPNNLNHPEQGQTTMLSPPKFLYDVRLSSSSLMAGQQQQQQQQLPPWISRYVRWHKQQRTMYPGKALFTDPLGPNLLVRTCLGLCGGLHDRLGQLPWDLYLAYKTNRVLLMAWQRPRELEHFLVPNTAFAGIGGDGNNDNTLLLDWTIPRDVARFGFDDIRAVRDNITELFEGYPEDRPDAHFWDVQLDAALARATGDGPFASIKILRHRLLGHLNETALDDRLETEEGNGSGGGIASVHSAPTFGNIFHLFFRPSLAVQKEIDVVLETLHLTPQRYTAVHCRVRHPKAHPRGNVVKGKNANYPADKTGLPWEPGNPLRQFAVETAQRALQCAAGLDLDGADGGGIDESSYGDGDGGRIYFLADSNDLVRHVTEELQNTTYVKEHQSNTSLVYPPLLHTIQEYNNNRHNNNDNHRRRNHNNRIVSRDVTAETAHIDRQKGRDPPAYYATFVDLYVAMHAKCVVYGVGYYAAFAAKLSGTHCAYLYAQEEWGSQAGKQQAGVCPAASAGSGRTDTLGTGNQG